MGPPSYKRSVDDRNVVMRRKPVLAFEHVSELIGICLCMYVCMYVCPPHSPLKRTYKNDLALDQAVTGNCCPPAELPSFCAFDRGGISLRWVY